MTEEKIKISIIIPSWDTKRLLQQCLRSVSSDQQTATSKKPITEVIVVDNGSTDGSPKMVGKEFPKVVLIKNKENLGYGAANNQGIERASGDYFLLLNSDTLIKQDAPVKMAKFMERHPGAGAVGCKLLNPDGSPQPSAGRFPSLWVATVMLFFEHWLGGRLVLNSYSQVREVDWVMGAALMVKREVIDKVGRMDEGIFMYMDEAEWCYRIKKAGYKVMFYPGARIVHIGGASSKTGRKDPILNIYRGLVYFYRKHYPSWQLPILRTMLKLKATGALIIGFITGNRYLQETYVQALKIA